MAFGISKGGRADRQTSSKWAAQLIPNRIPVHAHVQCVWTECSPMKEERGRQEIQTLARPFIAWQVGGEEGARLVSPPPPLALGRDPRI